MAPAPAAAGVWALVPLCCPAEGLLVAAAEGLLTQQCRPALTGLAVVLPWVQARPAPLALASTFAAPVLRVRLPEVLARAVACVLDGRPRSLAVTLTASV